MISRDDPLRDHRIQSHARSEGNDEIGTLTATGIYRPG